MPLQDSKDPEKAWRERLEERIASLETALRAGNTSIDRGKLRVLTDGDLTMETGKEIESDGETYDGMRLARSDGKTLMRASRFEDGTSRVEVRDKNGNPVLRDEKNLGGLSRPWIPIQSYTTNTNLLPAQTATFFGAIEIAYLPQQQPRIFAVLLTIGGVTTAGEVRLTMSYPGESSAIVVGGPWTVPANSAQYEGITFTVPRLDMMYSMANLNLEARVTSGAGSIYGKYATLVGLGNDL